MSYLPKQSEVITYSESHRNSLPEKRSYNSFLTTKQQKENSTNLFSRKYAEINLLINYLDIYLKPKGLSDLQSQVLQGAWEKKTYTEISQETNHDPDYIKGVGSYLFKIISQALETKVNKKNIRSITKRNYQKIDAIAPKIKPASTIINQPQSQELFIDQSTTSPHQFWDEVIDITQFRGRNQELALLEKWLIEDRLRFVALVGMGGMGKTFLATKLVKQIAKQFDYIIWRSLNSTSSCEQLVADLIFLMGDPRNYYLSNHFAESINTLMQCLRQKRCLIILDNFESVLDSKQDELNQQNYEQLLRRIQDETHQSCLLITSNHKPLSLTMREGSNCAVSSLKIPGLSLSEFLQIFGDYNFITMSDEEQLKILMTRYDGNPLFLAIALNTIESLFAGNIQAFLHWNTAIYGSIKTIIEQQFQDLSTVEQKIMSYLASESQAITLEQLQNQIKPQVMSSNLLEAIEALQRKLLIEVSDQKITQTSLIREYVQQFASTNSDRQEL